MYHNSEKSYQYGDEELFAHALDIIELSGLKGLTLRSLAQKAGISPSLLTYRFGKRQKLILRMFEHARSLEEAFWSDCQRSFSPLTLVPEHIPSIVIAVIMKATGPGRQPHLARWICVNAAARDPGQQTEMEAWAGVGTDFWRQLLGQAGADPSLGPALAAIMTGTLRIGLVGDHEPKAIAWISDLVLRATRRLLGLDGMGGDSPFRQAAEYGLSWEQSVQQSSRTDTPERIIHAAARLVLQHGPDAVTHRDIANDSNISLSSLTHHFGSLEEILLGAFHQIYEHAQRESRAGLADRMTIAQFTSSVLPEILRNSQARGHEAVAMDEIILATSRNEETRPISLGLMATIGRTSTSILQSMQRENEMDRLDGQILRFVLTGLTEQSSRLPDSERDAWMLTNCGLFLEHYL